MYPSYPTKTFPNHYTIVTGLYPESHGIIDNSMYDPSITPPEDIFFKMDATAAKNPQWWHGEPIWNTVVKNNMTSATYFWPGSEAPIQNMTPTYWAKYNKSAPFYQRMDQAMEWLLMPDEKRPDFLTLYFDQPDSDGHNFGPDSVQVTNTLLMVDAQVNYLLTRLFEEDLLHCINIVILADHGMQKVTELITFDEYVSTENLVIFGGPVARIHLNGSELTSEQIRGNLTCKSDEYRVYVREDVPRRMHFFNNDRIGDVIIDGDIGVQIFPNRSVGSRGLKTGDHGYDNRLDTMHALFLAWGPIFKRNHTIRPFQNIELYNMFADIMALKERAPNNGTLGTLDEIFVNPPQRDNPDDHLKIIGTCSEHQRQCGDCPHTETPICKSELSISHSLFYTTIDQDQCAGYTCNTSIVYNRDFQITTSVFEITNTKSSNIVHSNGCTNTTYSNIDCRNMSNVDRKLQSLNMDDNVRSRIWETQVPMYEKFFNDVWQNLENLTTNYTRYFGRLAILSGSIFDYDNNGLADDAATARKGSASKFGITDTLIPSHYYRIFLRCSTGQWSLPFTDPVESCEGDLQPLTFILGNEPKIDNCMKFENYLIMNMGKIRDVELLTGIQIFKTKSSSMFHKATLIRTKITDDLW